MLIVASRHYFIIKRNQNLILMCVNCITVIARRSTASLWSIIGSVIHQHLNTRFQPLTVKCSLQISLMPPFSQRNVDDDDEHDDNDVGSYNWNTTTTTSPVCKNFNKMFNHCRSLRLIIQYIFFSHCLFPVKASSYLSGCQNTLRTIVLLQ